jgi:CHAT domain-containing protein
MEIAPSFAFRLRFRLITHCFYKTIDAFSSYLYPQPAIFSRRPRGKLPGNEIRNVIVIPLDFLDSWPTWPFENPMERQVGLMRCLIVAALSVLILLCISISAPQGHGLHSIRWTPLMINLLRIGSPAATSLRPGAPHAQSSADELGAAPSAQESVSLKPGKPVERELSGGQSHSYKIAMTSGQYFRITISQREIAALVALSASQTGLGKKVEGEELVGLTRGFMYAGHRASSQARGRWAIGPPAS